MKEKGCFKQYVEYTLDVYKRQVQVDVLLERELYSQLLKLKMQSIDLRTVLKRKSHQKVNMLIN